MFFRCSSLVGAAQIFASIASRCAKRAEKEAETPLVSSFVPHDEEPPQRPPAKNLRAWHLDILSNSVSLVEMLQTQRIVILGAVLVLFFVLFTQCIQFIKKPKAIQFESFTNAGPTRPDDCLCLPGYVPSNTKQTRGIGGTIVRPPAGSWFFIPKGERTAYWIPSCRPQGINIDFCSKPEYQPRDVSWKELSSLVDSWDKTLTASLWNDIHKTTKTEIYFCQKLTDTNDTQKCTPLT